MSALAFVAAGGVAGVLARYGLTLWIHSIWTIAAVNVAGSFLLGMLTPLAFHLSHDARLGLGVGFLGGFTTLSTLTVQTVVEVDAGRSGVAAAYLAANVAGGLTAAAAGYMAGRALA